MDEKLINQKDDSGATPLHYAALNGNRDIVKLLIDRGAKINARDNQFGATPTGWAIEYLREIGGYLSIELDDLAYAIELGDVHWIKRFLQRFPSLRHENDATGKSFRQLAQESGHARVIELFN